MTAQTTIVGADETMAPELLSILDQVPPQSIFSGGWRAGGAGDLEVRSVPSDEIVARVGLADEHDVTRASALAAQAQPRWAQTPFRDRIEILRRAAAVLESWRDDFAALLVRESGSLPAKADREILGAIDELTSAAALLSMPHGELLPSADPAVTSQARRIPIGVIGVITPWNAPVLLAMRSIAPAIALGNAVVLKPDDKTALSGGLVLARVFEEAGLPEGVLHVLPGGPSVGEAIVRDPRVSMISFTGSSAVGRRIGAVAGGLLKRVVLELGGNNALIVLEDADLDWAVECAVRGALAHQGQICMATGRHIVVRDIADEFVERVVDRVSRLTMGDPRLPGIDVGPLITSAQAVRVDGIVTRSITQGARLLAGGERSGVFYSPTVLDDVTPTMAAFQEEIFGPVLPIVRVGDAAEAVARANETEYGLAAAVHTRSLDRGEALAAQLQVGMTHVNGQTNNDSAFTPMGGIRASGNGGRYGGHWNLDEFTYWQWSTRRPA